ncbi:MAG TPA: hypothetical protein VHG91_11695, partial [Longimicrobium sp.]|nr:hypothetical protein [Longimicrobium sp.]
MPTRFRPAAAALLALALAALAPEAARAQTSEDCRLREADPCPDLAPMAGVQPHPSVGSYALPVTIHWIDDFRLDFGTRRITFNGADVSASFTTPFSDGLREAYSQGTLTLTGGADTLVARICDLGVAGDTRCTEERVGVAYVPASEGALAHGDGEVVDAGRFAATLAYATPAYFSRDEARAVTLFYSSAQADPVGLVQVEVPADAASPPDRLSLKVRDAAGAFVPLRSGGDEVFFAGGAGPGLLTAQLAAGSLATGAHAYTAVVRRWRGTGVVDEAVPVRVLVVNESASRFGRGWSVPGAQRLQVADDGGRTVTEGDGTILYFQRACATCDTWLPPKGEYSTLHYLSGPSPYYERRSVDGRVAVFSATGLLQALRDPGGARTAFAYSGTRLASITDPAGKQIVFEADAAGFVGAIRDPAGRRSVLGYTGTALTQITDPAGAAALRPAYDAAGRLTGWTDRHGGTWSVALDAAATVDSLVAPAVVVDGGATVRPVTQLRSPVLAALPPAGKGTALAPAPRVRPDSVWAESADPRGHLTRTRVDRMGRALRVEEPLGFWTEVTRDAHGRPVVVRTSSGEKTTYAYNGFGLLTEEADSVSGRRVTRTYDAASHLLLSVAGDGPTRTFAYDGGQVVRTTRAGYGTTRHVYAGGRLSGLVHPDGSSTAYAYETTWGNVASVTDSTLAGKRATRYTYDASSRQRTVADTSGTSTTEHDALNRPTRMVDRNGSVTTIAYPGAATVLTDPAGRVHTLTRNALEWLVSEVRPGSPTPIAYTYDRGGNVASITNRRGQKTSFTHDARGRLLTRAAGGATAAYAYDNPAGRWIAAQNAESTDTLRLDASGRVTSSVSVMGGRRFERRYAYNARGQRTRMDFPAVGDSLVFRYDDAYRLTEIKPLGTGWTTRVTYDAEGRVDSLVSALGLARTFLHTPWGEPEWARFSAPALDSVFGHELAFDVRGRLESRGRRYDDAERLRLFEHDRAGRLTHWHDEERLFEERCEPDVYGYVVCQTDTLRTIGASGTFVYDSAGNRRNGATLHAGTHRYATFGALALTWDADGNLLTRVGGGVADT